MLVIFACVLMGWLLIQCIFFLCLTLRHIAVSQCPSRGKLIQCNLILFNVFSLYFHSNLFPLLSNKYSKIPLFESIHFISHCAHAFLSALALISHVTGKATVSTTNHSAITSPINNCHHSSLSYTADENTLCTQAPSWDGVFGDTRDISPF